MLNYSSSFKSLTRQKHPSWTNRIRKDFNDLNYYPKDLKNIQYIKKSPSIKSLSNQNKIISRSRSSNVFGKAMEKYNIQPYQLNKNRLNKSQSKKSFIQFKNQNNQNPENNNKQLQSSLKQRIYQNLQNKNSSFLNTTNTFNYNNTQFNDFNRINQRKSNENLIKLGLSQFQFGMTTIQGKIHSRYGYNVDLSKSKTNKINNVNKIFYNQDEEIYFTQLQKIKFVETLRKSRDFRIYSPHKLYQKKIIGQGGSLDKFYNVSNKQLNLIKKKTILSLDLKKITPRPDLLKKLGTQLNYPNSYREIAKSNQHKPLYQTQKIQRKLVFNRQIIPNTKGAYR